MICTIQYLTLVITALALVPGGAHFAVFLNKIDLPQTAYITVQDIYRR